MAGRALHAGGQLGHGDAVPSGRCGDGSDEPGWPTAENHQIGFTAFSVGPIRRMALLDSLLVVNQEIGFGGAETRQVTDRFIPEISASQLQADSEPS